MLFPRLYRYVLRSFNRHSTDRGFVQSNSFQSVRRATVLTTKLHCPKHSLLSRRNFGKNPLQYQLSIASLDFSVRILFLSSGFVVDMPGKVQMFDYAFVRIR